MASMAETLTEKRGGVPTYVWLLGGVGVLVVVMILRSKSQAKAAAANAGGQPGAAQSNVLNPEAALSLSQGASPMGYTGGDIYNNVATSATGSAAPAAPSGPSYNGGPGFFYKLGSSQLTGSVTDAKGNTYSFDPLTINGKEVTWQQFAQQAGPIVKQMGYSLSPPTGDYTLDESKLGIGSTLLPAGQNWLNGHSVDAQGNIVNTPSPQPVQVTSAWYGQAPTLSATPPLTR